MEVRISRLKKSFANRFNLGEVEFDVPSGQFFGIIGPNGSGKSTILKLISGVEKPDAGTVFLNGQHVDNFSRKQIAQQVAVLLQDALPQVEHSVRTVLEMGQFPFQKWWGNDKLHTASIIEDIAHKLCLEHLLDSPVSSLSGGERQRAAIGKAMAQQPQLLLLDEPTSYLDIGFQMQMMDMVRNWQRESGLTVVAVLHDLNLAAQYCDRILVLQNGKQIELGKPVDIMQDELIERVYGTKPIVLSHPVSMLPQILLQPAIHQQTTGGWAQ